MTMEGKSKEEILNYLFGISLKAGNLVPLDKGECMRAMDEYAKHQSIGFGIWINFNGWKEYDEPDRWICPTENNSVISTDQLYNLYLTSKSKS